MSKTTASDALGLGSEEDAAYFSPTDARIERADYEKIKAGSIQALAVLKEIGRDTTPKGAKVITRWKGKSVSKANEPPLYWETVVFGGPMDKTSKWAGSRDAAHAMHKSVYALALNAEEKAA